MPSAGFEPATPANQAAADLHLRLRGYRGRLIFNSLRYELLISTTGYHDVLQVNYLLKVKYVVVIRVNGYFSGCTLNDYLTLNALLISNYHS
jgi:hypothetical protein